MVKIINMARIIDWIFNISMTLLSYRCAPGNDELSGITYWSWYMYIVSTQVSTGMLLMFPLLLNLRSLHPMFLPNFNAGMSYQQNTIQYVHCPYLNLGGSMFGLSAFHQHFVNLFMIHNANGCHLRNSPNPMRRNSAAQEYIDGHKA